MSEIRCFMIEHTGECLRYLRRFSLQRTCADGVAFCNDRAFLDRAATPFIEVKDIGTCIDGTLTWPKDDPRWPEVCPTCHRVFSADDYYQVFILELYRRLDGEPGEYSVHCSAHWFPYAVKAPAGAMWFCDWMNWPGPDGRTVAVMLPDGTEWIIDGPSKSHGPGGWQRTGTPPDLVVRPSIASPNYHGFLGGSDGSKPGYLVEC